MEVEELVVDSGSFNRRGLLKVPRTPQSPSQLLPVGQLTRTLPFLIPLHGSQSSL